MSDFDLGLLARDIGKTPQEVEAFYNDVSEVGSWQKDY